MSHFIRSNLNADNLVYLKNVLNRMNVSYHLAGQDIILPQMKDKNAFFCWNNGRYTLFYDPDFWTNSLSITSFTETIAREYSIEKIYHCMNKLGFQLESYKDSVESPKYQTVKAKDFIFSRYIT